MVLQICPKCGKTSFTWYIDEEESSLTQWRCGCGYHTFEDETKMRDCPACEPPKSDLYMIDKESKYWWCCHCGRTEPSI